VVEQGRGLSQDMAAASSSIRVAQAANVNIEYSGNQLFLAGTSGFGLAGVPAANLTLAACTLHVPVIVLS
jgi:hypothetical protein